LNKIQYVDLLLIFGGIILLAILEEL
jgi:hypothetical protein